MANENLENEMMRLVNRWTVGAQKPVKILLHPFDFTYLCHRYGDEDAKLVRFYGVEVGVDLLAHKGEPLAIVRS